MIGHMFGDVDGGAAIFAAQRQTLQHTNHQQRNGCGNPDCCVGGQDADHRRGGTHDDEGDKKRVFAPDAITDAAEEQRAERPDDKSHGKRGEIGDERPRVVTTGIKQGSDDRGKTSENIEVVPFDHRPHR